MKFSHIIFKSVLTVLVIGACVSSAGAADVLIVGDSMMKSVARAIKKECAKRELSVEVMTSIGSGLARLDLLDWHQTVRTLVAEQKPKTVIIMMGANDNQAMQIGAGALSFGKSGWNLEYGRRAGKLMDLIVDGGVSKVLWLGLPCMRESGLDADVKIISRIVSQQAAARDNVDFVSTYRMFSKKGKYSAYVIQKSGMPLDVRSSDGIHLNRNGAELLAVTAMSVFDKE
jgi:hypothetical protein